MRWCTHAQYTTAHNSSGEDVVKQVPSRNTSRRKGYVVPHTACTPGVRGTSCASRAQKTQRNGAVSIANTPTTRDMCYLSLRIFPLGVTQARCRKREAKVDGHLSVVEVGSRQLCGVDNIHTTNTCSPLHYKAVASVHLLRWTTRTKTAYRARRQQQCRSTQPCQSSSIPCHLQIHVHLFQCPRRAHSLGHTLQ